MEKKRRMDRRTAFAVLVGFALILMVLLMQGGRLLGGWLASLFSGAMPEWLAGLYSLLYSAAVFVLPFAFLCGAGQAMGLRVVCSKGAVPLRLLFPLFIGVMVAVNACTGLLQSVFSALLQLPAAQAQALPKTLPGHLLYFLATCVGAAVFEELLFRGAVQGMMQTWGPRFAIVVTSGLFTLMHASLWEYPTVFVLGLMLGYVAYISKSVRPCIALHFANNTFAYVMLLVRKEMDTMAALAFIFIVMLAFVAMFAATVRYLRAHKLGSKMLLPADRPRYGTVAARVARLSRNAAFVCGVVAVLANFVLTVFVL